jgi:hypothetical protein
MGGLDDPCTGLREALLEGSRLAPGEVGGFGWQPLSTEFSNADVKWPIVFFPTWPKLPREKDERPQGSSFQTKP